ncbi:MAG: TetR/AcrR family transcriptional regulator [Dermabacteraceae bacterium]
MSTTEPVPTAKAAKTLTPRAAARERTMARIVELGNEQLREHGAAELSVREIARGLGVVSSAIYRYVASRDELLTLLIVDAYEDLADAVEAAIAAVPSADTMAASAPRSRFLALGDEMCAWAIAHPERWTLLYGTPVRGYSAPAETTNASGTRVMQAVLRIAADAALQGVGAGCAAAKVDLSPEVIALLEAHLVEFEIGIDASTEFVALTAWSSLVGVINSHVFGQLGPDAAALGEQILASQIRVLGDLIAPR